MQQLHFSRPAVPARSTHPLTTPPAKGASSSRPRRLGLSLGLALSLALAACGGNSNDNKDCGSAGNTRDLHCAP